MPDNEGFVDDQSEASYESTFEELNSLSGVQESSTQTESQTVLINSWKIQNVTLLNSNSSMYVVQTHSVGFNTSTQTLYRDLYSRNRNELVEIIASWRVLTVLIPSLMYLTLYFFDQLLDIVVCIEFYNAQHYWWFGFGLSFLVIPSILISIYAYEQLITPDVASIKPMKKKIARILCVLQLTPYYLIGRRFWWCLKAWSWGEHREETFQQRSQEIWKKASTESDSTTVKLFQSLLESVPQLSLQSYILLHELSSIKNPSGTRPPATLWLSVFVNLISASLGMASSRANNLFERIAGTLAIFITLGSRVMISGGIATFHPALWVTPVVASFIIGLVTKISESLENTLTGHLKRTQKYCLEALVMASVSPPFDFTGFFCSSVYFLAAVIFMMQDPSDSIHIAAPFIAVAGQILWILAGFCLMKE